MVTKILIGKLHDLIIKSTLPSEADYIGPQAVIDYS